MKRRVSTKLPVVCAVLCALAPSAAGAAERACLAPNVVSDEALRERWPDLVRQVRDEVLSRADIDTCASVTLGLAADSTVRVGVSLPDGRAASRRASRPEDVLPLLQALLLMPERVLIPAQPERSQTTTSTKQPLQTRPPATTRFPDSPDVSGAPLARRAGGLGVELSVIGGARFGDGQASYGVGAQSFLDISGWLIGFEGRADRYHHFSGAQSQTALELGALAGKRFRFRSVTLDVTAGPGFAIKGALSSETEVVVVEGSSPAPPPLPPPPPPSGSETSSGPVPRLLTGVRLGFSPRSLLRTFVGVDGTFGPARADEVGPSSPRMPRWTLGLTLGATVGTP